jgi:hypothetical protein
VALAEPDDNRRKDSAAFQKTHAWKISAHVHGFMVKVVLRVFFTKSFHLPGWGDVVKMVNTLPSRPGRSELPSVLLGLSASINAQIYRRKIWA